jgi:flagellar motility protein MotE (MotC chaperone)
MIRLLQSSWLAYGVGTIAYIATMILVWRPLAMPPPHSSEGPETKTAAGPSWTFQNPEVDLLIAELKKERDAVAAKEKELNELATRLQAERTELNQLTQQVQQVQTEFDQNVTHVREGETTNLKRLAKMYSSMSPEGALAVFKALDDATLVKVLTFMKDTETAPVLEAMARQGGDDAKRVAAISERLRFVLAEAKKNGT